MQPQTIRTVKIVLLTLLGVLALLCGYWLRTIFNPLLVAALIAYVLNPLVNWMERKRIKRTAAILMIYGVALVLVLAALGTAIPITYNQVQQFASGLVGEPYRDLDENRRRDADEPFTDENFNRKYDPGYLDRTVAFVRKCVAGWNARHADKPYLQFNLANILERVRPVLRKHLSQIARQAGNWSSWLFARSTSVALGMWAFVSVFLLIPIYTFFLLRGMNDIREAVYAHLPGPYRARAIDVLQKIHLAASSFFRGRLIICACVALLTAVGLMLCGVRFSILIGVVVGIGSLIPFVGVIIGLVPACLFAYLDHGLLNVAGVIVTFSMVQAIEGFVLTPVILGKETALHPITLIVSVFVGGHVFGLFGVLLAVPLASTLKILAQEFVLPTLRELARERSADAPGSA